MISKIIELFSILRYKLLNRNKITLETIKQKIRWNSSIKCGKNASIYLGRITAWEGFYLSAVGSSVIRIGTNVFFNRNCSIVSRELVTIGDGSIFGPNVYIYDHNHRFGINGISSSEYRSSPVIIGKNCWIGTNVVILKGTVIGDNCIIAAGTILGNCRIPSNSIVKNNRDIIIQNII